MAHIQIQEFLELITFVTFHEHFEKVYVTKTVPKMHAIQGSRENKFIATHDELLHSSMIVLKMPYRVGIMKCVIVVYIQLVF